MWPDGRPAVRLASVSTQTPDFTSSETINDEIDADRSELATTHAPGRSAPTRFAAIRAVVATLGVLVALVGLVWGTRPLSTPTQDCGTPFSFLLDGEVDIYVSTENPPEGVTPAAAAANNAAPCQERAADRALPAGALVVGGTLVGAVAAAVELGTRAWRWYRYPRS